MRHGIRKGAKQVLVLGAGYDALGWRLPPLFADVAFFEIDHPATAWHKARAIAAMGCPDNLHLVAEDLGKKPLSEVLRQHRTWATDEKTVIIAEGLVMYLPDPAVRQLFEQCAAISGAGSRIAFSYIPMGTDSRPDVGPWTGLMLWLQKVAGEPWLWSVSPEQLATFLKETGWTQSFEYKESGRKYGVEYYAVGLKRQPKQARA